VKATKITLILNFFPFADVNFVTEESKAQLAISMYLLWTFADRFNTARFLSKVTYIIRNILIIKIAENYAVTLNITPQHIHETNPTKRTDAH